MNTFESISENIISLFDNGEWVKWVHEGTKPAYTQEEKEWNLVLGAISRHCATCMNLNGCCFPKNNSPKPPLHPKCHCWLMKIDDNIQVSANCKDDKISTYIFDPKKRNGKVVFFESLGYDITDTKLLIQIYCDMAMSKYQNGDFTLSYLIDYGQLINIIIDLPSKDGNRVKSVKTSWMVYPNGTICLVTADGGKVK